MPCSVLAARGRSCCRTANQLRRRQNPQHVSPVPPFSGTPVSSFPAWTNSSSKRGLPSRPTCAEPWSWAPKFRRAIRPSRRTEPSCAPFGGEIALAAWRQRRIPGMIRADDEKAANPGDTMKELFNRFSPCLILISMNGWPTPGNCTKAANSRRAPSTRNSPSPQALSRSGQSGQEYYCSSSASCLRTTRIGRGLRPAGSGPAQNAIGRVESSWRTCQPGRRLLKSCAAGLARP